MASFTTSGIAELCLELEEIADIPNTVMDEIVLTEAKVIKKAQEESAKSMLRGPYSKDAVARAATIGEPRKMKDGRSVLIRFEGEQHGTRLAEIAFLNEFGVPEKARKDRNGRTRKRKGDKSRTQIAARPFIRTANESHADEAVDAAAKVFYDWQKSKNL